MVQITVELVRKKSEHNEKEISTLEEISLHQEDIEKIDNIQNWCKHLQILLLQSNLIPKIENLWKLKKLRYLNLALNNIERVEGLEGLESLEKLDLTLNFIGEIESVSNLVGNYHLKNLFLTGNPCTDFDGYRDYVIAVLPQLEQLDGLVIERSDRILAKQKFEDLERKIIREQTKYLANWKKERDTKKVNKVDEDNIEENEKQFSAEELEKYWSSPSGNTPEDRIQIAKMSRRGKRDQEDKKEKIVPLVKLVSKDGKRLNINQAKIPWTMTDEDNGNKILDIAVYKHLDTAFIDVDLHPTYVTVTIKGKYLQLVLNDEISVEKSTCQRSQITGHLVITMVPVNPIIVSRRQVDDKQKKMIECSNQISKRQYLEIGPPDNEMDFSKIVERDRKPPRRTRAVKEEKTPGADFIDDEDVPPLE